MKKILLIAGGLFVAWISAQGQQKANYALAESFRALTSKPIGDYTLEVRPRFVGKARPAEHAYFPDCFGRSR